MGYIELDNIPYTYHLGYNVPKILADLRDQMDFTNGLKTEGIFRLSGSETQIISLYEEYTTKGTVSHFDAHNAANLMKRWFKAWSESRLLGEIPMKEFEKSPHLDVASFLTEPRLSIWKWLLQLLLDIYAFKEFNKMSAKNIAIVWTPAIVGKQEKEGKTSDLNQTLLETQLGTTLLSGLLENDGVTPIKDNSDIEKTDSPFTPKGHTRSRSVSIGTKKEDSEIPQLPQIVQVEKPLHKRRTPIRRGVRTNTQAPAPLNSPPPYITSNSLSNLLTSPRENPSIFGLAELAKCAAIPPPICNEKKKPTRPPPSLKTPQQ